MGDDSYIYELPDQQPPVTFGTSFNSADKPEFTSQEPPKTFRKRGWSCLNMLQCVGVIVVGCLVCAGLAIALLNYHTSQNRGINFRSEISKSLADVCADFQRNFMFLHTQQNEFFANFTILLSRQQIELVANFTVLTELLVRGIPQSCTQILALYSSSPSGYYWIRSSNGSAVRVYCDMTLSCGNITGGWMRVAELNMTDRCPVGFSRLSNPSTCSIASSTAACPSVVFATNAFLYNRVCGRILAYQRGTTDAFAHHGRDTNLTIDSNYVDGISLTYGSKPRQHIWTFASANNEVGTVEYPSKVCQCSNSQLSVPPPPAFVGEDYFCDSGSSSNPLWDGAGCGPSSTCCSFNSPPWFHRVLSSPTTQDIEMRVCRDEGPENENIGLSLVEIYVQ